MKYVFTFLKHGDLFEMFCHWQFSRALDDEHVNNLEKIDRETLTLKDQLILESKDGLCVVNGQHRVEALQRILIKDDRFKHDLIVNVHPVESFDCEKERMRSLEQPIILRMLKQEISHKKKLTSV